MTIQILSTRRRRLAAVGAAGLALAALPFALLPGDSHTPAAAHVKLDTGVTALVERR